MTFPAHLRAPDTIVLLHGLWVTPRSWTLWVRHYRERGYRVLAPAYPGLEVEVEALNADPSPLESLSLGEVYIHLREQIVLLDSRPIIIGHNAGGVLTQLLLDAGYGVAGVAINSAPSEGLGPLPRSQAKSMFPVLQNPANRHRAVPFTPEQWQYAFCNTFSDARSRELYDRLHVPGPGRIVWDGILANFKPGHLDGWVDYDNPDRVPLLFISADEDNLMPPSVQRANARRYHPDTVTEVKLFPGPHLLPLAPNWREVADYALDWALEHAVPLPAGVARVRGDTRAR
ncbi:MAG: Pimeloyl-ACP methyl ester carboxylesterase [Thermoleophilia bacterium]|nr:Pimeloyl-ACP methyl ester carboxylesterase [Thermoleophilia bacterium]